jgi:TolA-binding protein
MKPLLDETNDTLERQLLEEARDYKASPKARAAALAIVGTGKPWLKGAGLKISVAVVGLAAIAGVLWMQRPAKMGAAIEPTPAVTTETTVTAHATISTTAPAPTADVPADIPPAKAVKALDAPQQTGKSTLAEEIAVIDRARAAVYSKDRDGAIRALDEYDRRFPKGSLAPEAKTLRARASAF